MKYLFIVSVAVFAFAISCAKKENKQKVGKPGAVSTDCKNKDKDSKACQEQLAKEKKALDKEVIEQEPPRDNAGAKKTEDVVETIPNLDQLKTSVILNDKTTLRAEIITSANNNQPVSTDIVCAEIKDLQVDKRSDITVANPDDLGTALSQILLFKDSSIVVDLKVNKGENATKTTKLFMLTCKSESKDSVTRIMDNNKEGAYVSKVLKKGQNTFELVALSNRADTGILTSFECNDDDQILKDTVRKQSEMAANRIRLRKGSAALVFRAVNHKVGDKKLSQLANEAQKKVQYSIISCEG